MKPSRTAASATGKVSSRVAGLTSLGEDVTTEGFAPAVTARLAKLRRRVVKMRDLPEEVEAFVDLFARYVLQTLGAEAFDSERAHDAAVEHCGAKDSGGELGLRGEVAVEAAGEGVACAGGVDDLSERQRGGAEGMQGFGLAGEGTVAEECSCAVLAGA